MEEFADDLHQDASERPSACSIIGHSVALRTLDSEKPGHSNTKGANRD